MWPRDREHHVEDQPRSKIFSHGITGREIRPGTVGGFGTCCINPQGLDEVILKGRFDRCGILVCSAGATRAGNLTELPDQAWIDGYALKFFGCVRMCRLFWPMLKAAQGCVANIGGGAARSPGADFSMLDVALFSVWREPECKLKFD
jgi:NAD(P)-dependent dehydrogenase (short-subunit alcohol dehydrogenase family)